MAKAKLIGDWIAEVTSANGWTPDQLATMTGDPKTNAPGITKQGIDRIVKNPGAVPELRSLRALARAFDIRPEEFYEWPLAIARHEARSTPEAAERRAKEAARKAAQRRRGMPPKAPPGQR